MSQLTASNPTEKVLSRAMPKRQDVQVRMRQRIRARLDQLGMTARELARAVGHDDAWISGVLAGAHGLHWKDFDKVADKLGIAPSELVRHDDAEVRELTPSEMKLLRHYQQWPRDMQDRWLALLDHLSAAIPDRETAEFLGMIRALPPSLRRPVIGWLSRLLEAGTPLEGLAADDVGGSVAARLASGTRHPTPMRQTPRGDRGHDDDR